MSMVNPAGRAVGRLPGTSVLWVAATGQSPQTAPGGLLRRRFRHGVELAWAPVDIVLAARDLSNLAVMAATLAVAALCTRDGGLTELIINLPALAVVWGASYGLIRLGRWWRGVRPPEHEPPCRQR
jgi:hypothetical protein